MYRVPGRALRGLRWGALGLAAVIATLAIATDPADARSRRKRAVKKYHHAETYNPRYAAIVLDANTGRTLHETSADSLRHPASLTKIMTLYLLFEQLEAGKIKLSTAMEVSAEAASQAPTKLGVRPGETLTVQDAIKALITKSANDAAVVVAEALAGSEAAFARQMTRKARTLGMSRTIYRNASGLPDDEQVTTAREQALLGIAIQERFPRYYRYFSLTSFSYRGRAMRNHNKLLGRVNGVDGIKTGYTRASGFNLTTSMHRGDRHIVAVVLGGSSGAQRDARMRSLIEGHIALASTTRTATKIAAAPASEESRAKPKLAAAASVPATTPPAAQPVTGATNIGSTDPIKPVPVKTLVVKLAPPKTAPAIRTEPARPEPLAAKPAPMQTASLGAVSVPEPQAASPAPAQAPPPGARPGILGVLPVAVSAAGKAIVPAASAAEPKALPATARSGWAIQIGAFEAEAEARQRLTAAQSKAGNVLKKADGYTERTTKGEKTYYRARFAGFDRDQAEAACRQLKRSDIACMALKI
jgi:D-alanyl-D-alanine carboxypeptidase